MTTHVFRFGFASGVDIAEAESTLHLAILAAEGLFGEARVRTEFAYHVDAPRRAIILDGASPPGEAVVRIFVTFLTGEFGAGAFTVRRVSSARRADTPSGDFNSGRIPTGAAA